MTLDPESYRAGLEAAARVVEAMADPAETSQRWARTAAEIRALPVPDEERGEVTEEEVERALDVLAKTSPLFPSVWRDYDQANRLRRDMKAALRAARGLR